MRRTLVILVILGLFGMMAAEVASAEAIIKINDKAHLDLGIRIQPYYINKDFDVDGDGEWDTITDYKTRRARLRLKAVIGEYVTAFIQSEVSGSPGTALGEPARIIDAYVALKAHDWFRFYTGLNMAPVFRQNLTSSGAMLAAERPSMTYKNLSWGNRAFVNFATSTLPGADSGIRVPAQVRDTGVTLFGSGKLGESKASLKYYLGAYDGVQTSGEHNDRYTGRVQLNFFDREAGYYNLATYLGKKKTIGIGAAFDTQKSIAATTGGETVDYMVFTADAFCEWPLENGMSLTLEGGWSQLDLDDAQDVVIAVTSTGSTDWRTVQGSGFYVQGGLLVKDKWQPWAEFEQWASDGVEDAGSFTIYRVGVSYFIEGQNANLKLGFENLSTEVPIVGEEDSQKTILLGTYITY